MEAIAAIQETAVPLILERTIAAFQQPHEKNRATIEAVPRRTFSFGPAERNKLDIYYPAPGVATAPVLVFIYGGGFMTGERALPPPALVFANVGAYFAARGFLVAVPDYTLLPAPFPLPAAEVHDAIAWIAAHADDIAAAVPDAPRLDATAIHTLGHSAGGCHLATAFLLPELAQPAAPAHTLVLSGAALDLAGSLAVSPPAVGAYFGGADVRARHPAGLLADAPAELLRALPRVVIVQAEREYEGLEERVQRFKALLEARMAEVGGGQGGWTEVPFVRAKGHNHISINLALATGEGEEWAEELIKVLRSS
ncbi:Alpha/Beta hydrolase protein [Vararia minispora EC-137]|uniref:Alpha/Beta hydrolase protein n=1 Tax=Vararia minispora EC-137 TaxID=1314806 RepID=A0ACB8QHZ1_9AGAM|nr:Alpha/Beta hydrolase protein [Vararia minispora EC-137]